MIIYRYYLTATALAHLQSVKWRDEMNEIRAVLGNICLSPSFAKKCDNLGHKIFCFSGFEHMIYFVFEKKKKQLFVLAIIKSTHLPLLEFKRFW